MAKMTTIAIIAIVTTISVSGWAQGNQGFADENAQLKSRVESLEKQVQELTGAGGNVGQPTAGARTSMWSDLDVQFYGFVKADAAYDTSQTQTGNFVLWVWPEGTNSNDDEFNVTANETRLGFNIGGPKGGRVETSGKVEFDFYGSGAEENKARFQMRHAYLQILWPGSGFGILAGQTSDVIAPLNPSTLNYTVLWDAGNIGYRRPQFRVTQEFSRSPNSVLTLQAAISRTIGSDRFFTESGSDAGYPTFQGRIGYTFPLFFDSDPTTVGVSGHCGREEWDIDTAGNSKKFSTWSLNFDLLQPIAEQVALKLELFTGANLGSYFGGIGQGVNLDPADRREISSKGGWGAVALGPWDRWRFNVGMGIDDPDDNDVSAAPASIGRTYNRSIFGNVVWAVNEHTDAGFELSHWRTKYRSLGHAEDVRFQAALKYKF